jgi:outer membrane protein assembly factor BamB
VVAYHVLTVIPRFSRVLGLVGAAMLAALLVAPSEAAAAVSVFPIPGSRFSMPATQITFRGVSPGSIGSVSATGSRSGLHSGRLAADSDGDGASFIPSRPFTPGETVTVQTRLSIVGVSGGTYEFSIAHPAPPPRAAKLPRAPAAEGQLQHFVSRPDLVPPSVQVKGNAPAGEGDIFVAPQFGPAEDGPMILGARGDLIWFRPTPIGRNVLSADFRVQNLHGEPVLTWWQGVINHGEGRGEGLVLDRRYEQTAVVQAGNGLSMDLHEFKVTPDGDAYFLAAEPVRLPGVYRPVIDGVVQEVDIKTGLVLFEWHALDHVPLSASYLYGPKQPGHVLGPFHLNSVSLDRDGNLIVSARNTSAVYKIDHETGAIVWQYGGKDSSFTMGPGTVTAFQHDAHIQPDGTLTVFDDGAGPPRVHPSSRGIRVRLNAGTRSASLVQQYGHSPALSANFEGDAQLLSGGNVFLGWGQRQFFSEDNSSGQQIFDASFEAPTSSYRAYRFRWSGQPMVKPALSLTTGPHDAIITHESWNGATNVSGWSVLSGSTPTALHRTRRARKYKFEATITIQSTAKYVQVQALGPHARVLASSRVLRVP